MNFIKMTSNDNKEVKLENFDHLETEGGVHVHVKEERNIGVKESEVVDKNEEVDKNEDGLVHEQSEENSRINNGFEEQRMFSIESTLEKIRVTTSNHEVKSSITFIVVRVVKKLEPFYSTNI